MVVAIPLLHTLTFMDSTTIFSKVNEDNLLEKPRLLIFQIQNSKCDRSPKADI